MLISNVAYVTGSNAIKAGFQWHIGQTWNTADANGDLTERFRDGVPDSVIVYNTPARLYNLMGADMGLYVQDSWTLQAPDGESRPALGVLQLVRPGQSG